MQIAGIFLLPNGTFFVELAILLIILFVTTKFILPPLNKAMEERQDDIRSSLEAAESARADAAAADDERRGILEASRIESREIVATAQAESDAARADAQARGRLRRSRSSTLLALRSMRLAVRQSMRRSHNSAPS